MTTSDKLLEALIKRVNQGGELLDITLTVNGSTITGKLAPRGEWLKAVAKLLESTGRSEYAADFTAEAGAMDTEEYLHLSGGSVLFGAQQVPPKGSVMRVPVAAVDAWMIGRVQVDRA